MVPTFKTIAMDASVLKWIVGFIGAVFLLYVVGCAFTARCKAVCVGIVILRSVTCGCPVTGPQRVGGNWPATVHYETAGPPFGYQSGVCESGVERSELSIA